MNAKALLCLLFAVVLGPSMIMGMYDEDDAVFILTNENFESELLDSDDYWIVEFYAPWCGHCKKLTPEWKDAAQKLVGVAKLGAVDCTEESELQEKYGVKGYPTIKVFANGGGSEPVDYEGGRESQGIVDFVRKAHGEDVSTPMSTGVTHLTYLDAFKFLYQLYVDSPKGILFTEGEPENSTPGWYTTLAVKFKKGKNRDIAFAQVRLEDPDAKKIAERFGVTEPGFLVVKTESPQKGWFTELGSLGEKGSESTVLAKELCDEVLGGMINEDDQHAVPTFPEPDKPRKQASPTFVHLTEDNMERDCYKVKKKSICIMALVAAIGGQEFGEHDVMAELSRKYRNDPIAFGWVDASNQNEFVSSFGIEWDGTAKLVAVKTGKRSRYSLMEGEMKDGNLNAFVDKILGGDMQYKNIKALPELVPAYLQDMDEE